MKVTVGDAWARRGPVDVLAYRLCVCRPWCCGAVVGGDTAKWIGLSEKTSTLAPAGMTIDTSAENAWPATKSAHAQIRSIMSSSLGQQLWKGTLVSGVLTTVLGVMVLVW